MKREPKINLKLIPLAWPICIEGITGSLVNFADTFFLSRISDEVASSVGMLGAVLLIGYWVLPSFTSAGTSVAAQYIGAGKKDDVKPTYLANLLISVMSGILLSLFFFLASGRIGLWLGMSEIQNSYAQAYMEVIAVNFIFVGLRFSYASILASKTLTRYNMAATVVTNLLNVFLNWAFLYGFWIFPQMGIHGIALATVISYAAGFLILLPIVHLRLRINFYARKSWLKLKKVVLPILKIGIPSALEPFSYTFQNMIVSFLVIKFGVEAMSANTYVLRLIQLDLTVSWSLATAGQIIMSHYLGAGNWKEVDRSYWKAARYSMIFAAINLAVY
ncbi:MAG TPA: MATE family efflux transporter, partial [Spirochaetota bacterium]|nr:MATE family efflux transporter [Spirochaetota bacterium]